MQLITWYRGGRQSLHRFDVSPGDVREIWNSPVHPQAYIKNPANHTEALYNWQDFIFYNFYIWDCSIAVRIT